MRVSILTNDGDPLFHDWPKDMLFHVLTIPVFTMDTRGMDFHLSEIYNFIGSLIGSNILVRKTGH